jgi:hypothetical protein
MLMFECLVHSLRGSIHSSKGMPLLLVLLMVETQILSTLEKCSPNLCFKKRTLVLAMKMEMHIESSTR